MPVVARTKKPAKSKPVALTKPAFIPTNEQRMIGVGMSYGEPMLINASAGTGKTATLVYLHSLSNKTGEMWCFNKRNALEAATRFDKKKTYCCTSHSKAFRALEMFGFGSKLNEKWPNWMIAREMGIGGCSGVTAEHLTHAALQSLRRWMHSADPEITIDHCWDHLRGFEWFKSRIDEQQMLRYPDLPVADRLDWLDNRLPGLAAASLMDYRRELLRQAKDLWAAMWDRENPFPMDHDAYLKAYQLTKPIIKDIGYLMVDEYQDTNPCVADIVNQQTCQVIVVGDEYQGINGFRGATQEMRRFVGSRYGLTESWRYGPNGAKVANAILGAHYPDAPIIRGNRSINTVLAPVDRDQPYAVICRTNAELFTQAVKAVSARQPMHVIGKLRDAVSRVKSVYGLFADDRSLVKHPDIKPYEDWKTVLAEAELDTEIKRYVECVGKYGHDMPGICEQLDRAGEVAADRAQVILTTAHKSKGLEFDQVVMANDFRIKIVVDEATGRQSLTGEDEEFNCLYVTATRAVKRLEVNGVTQVAMEMAA